MMPSNEIAQAMFGLTLFDIVKWFVVVGLAMYLGFAVIIIRQVAVMSEALPHDFNNGLIKLFAWAHLLMTLLLLVLTIMVL